MSTKPRASMRMRMRREMGGGKKETTENGSRELGLEQGGPQQGNPNKKDALTPN